MNDFKAGDRVRYVATRMTRTPELEGHEGTVTEIKADDAVGIQWDDDSIYNRGGYLTDNLRLIGPAPDVLTIDRAELPEVVERDNQLHVGCRSFGFAFDATQHRKRALAQLAVSEFLAAREKAEQDAADQHAQILNKRRDELIVQFMPEAARANNLPTWDELNPTYQRAINYAIQLEGQVKK